MYLLNSPTRSNHMLKIAKYLMVSLLILSSNNALLASSDNGWNYTKIAIGAVGGVASLLCFWKAHTAHQQAKKLKKDGIKVTEEVRAKMQSDFDAINTDIQQATDKSQCAALNTNVSAFADKSENQEYLKDSAEFQSFKSKWSAFPRSLQSMTHMKAASANDPRPKSNPNDSQQYQTMTPFASAIVPVQKSSGAFLRAVTDANTIHTEKVNRNKYSVRRWAAAGTVGVAGTAVALWLAK